MILASFVESALCGRLLTAKNADPHFRPTGDGTKFPPTTEFPVKAVHEARDAFKPSEVVLGVVVGKESRAYPVNMMMGGDANRYHVLNDKLGGRAIAATW
jgi:hypothetical protein